MGHFPGEKVLFVYTNSDHMFDDDSPDKLLESIRMKDKKLSECPDVVISEDDSYTAVLETGIADIHIELFPYKATEAVNIFIFLAGSGWFDGIRFQGKYERAGDNRLIISGLFRSKACLV